MTETDVYVSGAENRTIKSGSNVIRLPPSGINQELRDRFLCQRIPIIDMPSNRGRGFINLRCAGALEINQKAVGEQIFEFRNVGSIKSGGRAQTYLTAYRALAYVLPSGIPTIVRELPLYLTTGIRSPTTCDQPFHFYNAA